MTLRPSPSAILAGWSLANVAFLDQWHQLLRVENPEVSFFLTRLSPANYFALFTNVLWVGTAAALIAVLAVQSRSRAVRWISTFMIAAGCAYVLNSLRREFLAFGPLERAISAAGRVGSVAVVVSIAILVTAAVTYFVSRRAGARTRLVSVVKTAGLLFSPFLLYTFGSAAFLLLTNDLSSEFAPAPLSTVAPKGGLVRGRVMVVIFDEADYRLMFVDRPPGLALPNFDRLRRESVFAASALPPAGHTEMSVPSYLIGRHVIAARPVSANDAELQFRDDPGKWQRMSSFPSLFSAANSIGARAGVVGWSQPYCRFPGQRLSECYARSGATPPVAFFPAMAWQLGETLTVGPFLDRAYGFGLPYHTLDYVELMRHAERIAASPDLDLVWIHLPVPHEPRIYDRRTNAFVGPELHNRHAYPDNLALADIALGRLRTQTERAGLWEATNVIVTSDHAYRLSARDDGKTDPRIPFMVKIAGQRDGVELSEAFNTIVLHGLVIDFLSRPVASIAQVTSRLRGSGLSSH